jgi:hypothetical protein
MRAEIRAHPAQSAVWAIRCPRMTDSAAQSDQVQVRGRILPRAEQSRQVIVRRVRRHPRRTQSQTARHAVHVGVNREGG